MIVEIAIIKRYQKKTAMVIPSVMSVLIIIIGNAEIVGRLFLPVKSIALIIAKYVIERNK